MNIKYHHTERDSGIPDELQELISTDKRFKSFQASSSKNEIDYRILGGKPEVGIERKEINDLVGSMEERKIPKQIVRIIDEGLVPIFLVEGVLPNMTQTQMEWKSVYGFISWLSECDVIVHHTLDFLDTALRVLNIATRIKKGDFKAFKVPVPIIKAQPKILQRLMGIEGVGEELADKIRGRYKDHFDFLIDCEKQVNLGKSRLLEIKGIGQGKANKIAVDTLREW